MDRQPHRGARMQLAASFLVASAAILSGCESSLPGGVAASAGGCGKDTDCKGDRICVAGACIGPAPWADASTPRDDVQDLAVPDPYNAADAASPSDLTPPADLAPPDDLALTPDLSPPLDLVPPPDLWLPCSRVGAPCCVRDGGSEYCVNGLGCGTYANDAGAYFGAACNTCGYPGAPCCSSRFAMNDCHYSKCATALCGGPALCAVANNCGSLNQPCCDANGLPANKGSCEVGLRCSVTGQQVEHCVKC